MRQEKYPGFYSASETLKKLGITEGTLYTHVRNGVLTRHTPPGKKYGVYKKEEVDDLAHELRTFVAMRSTSLPVFARAQPADMPEIARLLSALFDGGIPATPRNPATTRLSWLKKNPDTCFTLKSGVDDKLMAVAFVLPLERDYIDYMLSQEATPRIEDDRIGTYAPGVPTHLWVMSLGVQPRLSKAEKRFWGSRLIANLIKFIVELGTRGVDLRTIAARSETPDGIRILRHMGFTEVPSLTSNRNFLIDVATSGIPEIEGYKQALATWQAQHAPVAAPGRAPAQHQRAGPLQGDTLPAGLEIAAPFAKRHGIAESTLNKAIDAGRLLATIGEWKVGRATIRRALDAGQQRAFFDLYPRFHECDQADCMCHERASQVNHLL